MVILSLFDDDVFAVTFVSCLLHDLDETFLFESSGGFGLRVDDHDAFGDDSIEPSLRDFIMLRVIGLCSFGGRVVVVASRASSELPLILAVSSAVVVEGVIVGVGADDLKVVSQLVDELLLGFGEFHVLPF